MPILPLRPQHLGKHSVLLLLWAIAFAAVGSNGCKSEPTAPPDSPSAEIPDKAEAPRLVEPEPPAPRTDENGILLASPVPVRGGMVPQDYIPIGSDQHLDILFVEATTDEMRQFLETHYPTNDVVVLRDGAALRADPPKGQPGTRVLANAEDGGYRLSLTEVVGETPEVGSPPTNRPAKHHP